MQTRREYSMSSLRVGLLLALVSFVLDVAAGVGALASGDLHFAGFCLVTLLVPLFLAVRTWKRYQYLKHNPS